MLDLFTKPLEEITISDLQSLRDSQYPEDDTIEYKAGRPDDPNDCYPWKDNEYSGIKDGARNDILAEIIAFANTHGGTLLIGVDEEEKKAKAILPIPECEEAAERLQNQIIQCIEPKLASIPIKAIPTEGKKGIVIIRIPQSYKAPHRSIPTKECYRRFNDRSEKISMIDIQDLTLNMTRRIDRIEDSFKLRRELFQEFSGNTKIRMTFIPIGELYLNRVCNLSFLDMNKSKYVAKSAGKDINLYGYVLPLCNERPILRGTQRMGNRHDEEYQVSVYQDIYSDGLFEIRYSYFNRTYKDASLHWDWLIGSIVKATMEINDFRIAVGVPNMEYGLEIEIWIDEPQIYSPPFDQYTDFNHASRKSWNPLLFPRYSINSTESFDDLYSLIAGDILDAIGLRIKENSYIPFKIECL